MRIEGKLRVCYLRYIGDTRSLTVRQGFDEFMNLVIDDAVEVTLANAKKDAPEERRNVGQILLKGDNITLIQQLQ